MKTSEKAHNKPVTPKEAIAAFCDICNGEPVDCDTEDCALYPFMPYNLFNIQGYGKRA